MTYQMKQENVLLMIDSFHPIAKCFDFENLIQTVSKSTRNFGFDVLQELLQGMSTTGLCKILDATGSGHVATANSSCVSLF